jgi:hypothetical protein
MQQVKLYSPAPIRIDGPDLKVEPNDADHTYTITHFGAAVTITVTPA